MYSVVRTDAGWRSIAMLTAKSLRNFRRGECLASGMFMAQNRFLFLEAISDPAVILVGDTGFEPVVPDGEIHVQLKP